MTYDQIRKIDFPQSKKQGILSFYLQNIIICYNAISGQVQENQIAEQGQGTRRKLGAFVI